MLGFFKPLITFSFWFSLFPQPFSRVFDVLLLWGNVAVILAGIALLVFLARIKLEKDLRRPTRFCGAFLIWFGLVGLLLYAFTWLRIPILSMRFFYLVWLAGYGAWAWRIWKDIFMIRPQRKREEAERAAYEKWLPKPKKS